MCMEARGHLEFYSSEPSVLFNCDRVSLINLSQLASEPQLSPWFHTSRGLASSNFLKLKKKTLFLLMCMYYLWLCVLCKWVWTCMCGVLRSHKMVSDPMRLDLSHCGNKIWSSVRTISVFKCWASFQPPKCFLNLICSLASTKPELF